MRFQSIFKTTILLVLVTASCDAPSTTIPSNSPPANTASPVPTTQAPDSSLPAITPAPSETIEAADTSTPVLSPSYTPTASPHQPCHRTMLPAISAFQTAKSRR